MKCCIAWQVWNGSLRAKVLRPVLLLPPDHWIAAMKMPAKIAEVITPLMLAPSACGSTTASGVTSATHFCATLAVVGRQLTPAMPITGLNFFPLAK